MQQVRSRCCYVGKKSPLLDYQSIINDKHFGYLRCFSHRWSAVCPCKRDLFQSGATAKQVTYCPYPFQLQTHPSRALQSSRLSDHLSQITRTPTERQQVWKACWCPHVTPTRGLPHCLLLHKRFSITSYTFLLLYSVITNMGFSDTIKVTLCFHTT